MVRSDHGIPSLELPMRFYKTKPKRTPTAPRLGEHTEEILAELGYSL